MPKPPLGLRVLILAPVGQDARLIAKALVAVGLDATAVTSMDEVIERSCQDGVGTLLIAEEALTPSAVQKLSARLSAQDSWEDLSVLILTAGGQSTAASRKREEGPSRPGQCDSA